MKRKLKYLIILIILVPILIFFFVYTSFGIGQYNYLYPYIDTKLPLGFDEANFNQVQPGMTNYQVEYLIGEPLEFNKSDYYLLKKYIGKDIAFSASYSKIDNNHINGNYAWKSLEVYYNKDTIVVARISKWVYN